MSKKGSLQFPHVIGSNNNLSLVLFSFGFNYKNINNPKGRDKLLEFIDTYHTCIIDPFRAAKIRQNKKIKGIKVSQVEFKISQYADDTSVILDGTEASLNQTRLFLS